MGEAMKLCSHQNCGSAAKARGMCKRHYEHWMYHHPEASTKNEGYREAILNALPGTRAEIEAKVPCNEHTVERWLTKLRGKEIRVCGWKRTKAIYAIGTEPDAPYNYKRVPGAEVSRQWRKRNKEMLRIKLNARRAVQRAKSKQNTWLGALGVTA
jgi:hypothetical protein